MVKSTNMYVKLIKNITKILHVLPHLKCSAGHHIPKNCISESKGIERNKQEYLESWENCHIKKWVQQDQAIPSSTKASSMERHRIMCHKHVPNEREAAINSWCM